MGYSLHQLEGAILTSFSYSLKITHVGMVTYTFLFSPPSLKVFLFAPHEQPCSPFAQDSERNGCKLSRGSQSGRSHPSCKLVHTPALQSLHPYDTTHRTCPPINEIASNVLGQQYGMSVSATTL